MPIEESTQGFPFWRLFLALLSGTLALAIFIERFHLWDAPLTGAWGFEGDGLIVPGNVKAMIEEGWFLVIKSWGAPEIFYGHDFPLSIDSFHCLVFKIIGVLTQDVNIAINTYFLGRVWLAAFSMAWALSSWKVTGWAVLVGGIVFGVAPTHLARGLGHNFLGIYYILPWVLNFWLHELSQPTQALGNRSWIKRGAAILLPAFILGGSGAYYVAFYLMIASVGILILGAQSDWSLSDWLKRSAGLVLSCGTVAVTAFFWNLPLLLFNRSHGANPLVAGRAPFESELYGLKISYLFGPATGNPFSRWWDIYLNYNKSAPLTTENVMGTLGILGGLGFLLGGYELIKWTRRISINPPVGLQPVLWAARANLFFVLLATIGGVGSIVAYLLFPGIRAYNRASIFLSFFSILIFCLEMDRLQNWFRSRIGKLLPVLLWLLIGFFGVSDLVGPRRPGPTAYLAEEKRYLAFMQKFEAKFEAGTQVLLLPYHRYPEAGDPSPKVSDYFQLKYYLTAKKRYHWSYPNMTGRPADLWLSRHIADSPSEWIYKAYARGFRAIILNRGGYAGPTQELEKTIRAILGPPQIDDEATESVVWKLEPIIKIEWDPDFKFPLSLKWDPSSDIVSTIATVPIPSILRQSQLRKSVLEARNRHQNEVKLGVQHPAVDWRALQDLSRTEALPPEGLKNHLECPKEIRLKAGTEVSFTIQLTNLGSFWWPAKSAHPKGHYQIQVRNLELRNLDTQQTLPISIILPLDRPLAPGATRVLTGHLPKFDPLPSTLSLELDLVQEQFAWANQFGGRTCKILLRR